MNTLPTLNNKNADRYTIMYIFYLECKFQMNLRNSICRNCKFIIAPDLFRLTDKLNN